MTEQEILDQFEMFEKYLDDPLFVDFLLAYWIGNRISRAERRGGLGKLSELEAHEMILAIRGEPTRKMEQERAQVLKMFKELLTS